MSKNLYLTFSIGFAALLIVTGSAAGASPVGDQKTRIRRAEQAAKLQTAPDEPDLDITKRAEPVGIPWPGDRVTFTLSVSNTGSLTATSVVITDVLSADITDESWAATGSLSASTVLSDSRYVWALPALAPGSGGVITVLGTISSGLSAPFSISNMAQISSQEMETHWENNTSTVTLEAAVVWLPWVGKLWPPVPDAPVLHPIENADGNGSYTVSWGAALLADAYVLEEDDDPSFPSPMTTYDGSETEWNATGQTSGKHYYRVKAVNTSTGQAYGSEWSNAEAVTVWHRLVAYATADTYISKPYPDRILGGRTEIWAGYDAIVCLPHPCGIVRSLVGGFDLSGVPPTAIVRGADLVLWRGIRVYHTGTQHTFTAYQITSPWSENATTWRSRPDFGTAYGSVVIGKDDSGDSYSFDVAALVQGWIDGSVDNWGIMVRGPEDVPASAFVAFETSEPGGGETPRLFVWYE